MRLGIDASNIRTGGGVMHLQQLLVHADPAAVGIDSITVWTVPRVLSYLPERPWLQHRPTPAGNLFAKTLWQHRNLYRQVETDCDILFSPGGRIPCAFRPVVTMSQNMLPFMPEERRRYGVSRMGLRLLLLRWLQGRSFRQADGVIFLTEFARDHILRAIGQPRGQVATIPHGINAYFFQEPRPQRAAEDCTSSAPYRLIYTSVVDVYKHQWAVAEAVASLRARGLCLTCEFRGPSFPHALHRLKTTLNRLDPGGTFLTYGEGLPNEEMPDAYARHDAFIFASSCENMPIIMLEAMASGIPICSANRGPMPSMLGDGGVYFDPESPEDIAEAILRQYNDADLRLRQARLAHERAREFSWPRCASETLTFLRSVHESAESGT